MSFRAQPSQRKGEILVVTPGFATPGSGAAHAAGELITAISRRAPFHFTWVAHGGGALPNIPGQTMLPMHGWNMVEKPLGRRWPFWNRQSLHTLRQAVTGADLVWLHDTLYPGAVAAFRMARASRKPVLITQHDSPAFYAAHGELMRRGWIRLVDRLVTSRLLRKAHQVTFTSDAAARFYHRRVRFRTPVRIIPDGIEGQVFRPPSADDYRNLRARFALRDDQPVLLFAGRFDAASGLPVIRHLAQLLPKWRFWITGQGRIKPEAWYLPNVQVFRNRTGGALAELYQAADLLILPGYDPEAPHVLQRALACQLPVMCSPAAISGSPGAPRCLVAKIDPASPELTATHWAQKLKAGKDVWPTAADAGNGAPFDSSWDWLQVAAHYTEILNTLCRSAA